MQAYWLGSQSENLSLNSIVSKWNIQHVENQNGFKSILSMASDKARHFLMELSEINEKKYLELKALNDRFGKKLKFIIFYQTLKPSPVINKLHGAEILLIGPEDRNIAEILLKRFFQNPNPLFRRWERFHIVTSGTLSLLSDAKAGQKVAVVNFSAHGARLKFSGNAFNKKDYVALEYMSHDGKKIRMQSRIAWVQSDGQNFEAGVQFISREV